MANFDAKIILQMNRFSYVKSVALEASDGALGSLKIQAIVTKLGLLNSNWEKFEAAHERLLESKLDKALLEHEYFEKSIFDLCVRHYADAKAALLILQDEKGGSFIPSVSQQATLSIAGATSTRRSLPEITLPSFSGTYSSWRSFQDLFSSMVGENPEISSVEKMHYLRTCLSGEAAQLISNLPVSGDSFLSAWNLLLARYENKRLLITAQLEKLFGAKSISSRSSRELNSLLNSTSEALNALVTLGAPVQHWDHLLVHLVVRRLDNGTRESWEVKLGSSMEPPSYENLKVFLTGRARALESIEFGAQLYSATSSRPAGKPQPARAHVITAPLSGDSSSYNCAVCSKEHYIVMCPKFREMTPQLRRDFVVKNRLCYNCLGHHNANSCQSQKRCRDCGNKHHTMIHNSHPQVSQAPAINESQSSDSNTQTVASKSSVKGNSSSESNHSTE